jgi:hypothetical protein
MFTEAIAPTLERWLERSQRIQLIASTLMRVMNSKLGVKAVLLLELGLLLSMLPLMALIKLSMCLEYLALKRKNPLITLLFYLLCERDRIEWSGHFDEARERWQGQGLSPWIIRYKTSRMLLSFLRARVRCLVDDRIFARYWEKF